jgi:1,4-alpha-glucan branching enzyme
MKPISASKVSPRPRWRAVRALVWVGCLLLSSTVWGQQLLQVSPSFPTADGEITLTFDLKQAKDGRASGLLGKTSDVFLWAWGGFDAERKNATYGPPGQSDFSKAFDPGKMTSLGNDRWQIKLTPRKYLGVADDKALRWMGVLLKNGAGNNQTEDLTFALFENKLNVSILTPTQKSFFVEANAKIPVLAVASQRADLVLSVAGAPVAAVQNRDTLRFEVNAGNQTGVFKTVKISAKTNTETASEEFQFAVRPQPTVAELPTGLRDGINYISDTEVVLSLFAPKKNFVYVVGDFSNWDIESSNLMNRSADGNRYWIRLSGLRPGVEYAFQYVVDGTLYVGDPYAEKILDPLDRFIPAKTYPNLKAYPEKARGTCSVFQTAQRPYAWKTNNFKRPANEDLVIYELHVRDFVADQDLKSVIDTLPYLKKLGVNAIELMPIMEFAGNDSWGYNPIYFMAPDKAYGTANDLKRFIDICHENGMAVLLDMVLNHADYEFPYVKMYWDENKPSADSPFFNQAATHPFSVFFDFNHESTATQTLVDRINEFWIKEYRFDGYRFDLSKGFTQRQSSADDRFRLFDQSRVNIWKRIMDKVRAYDQTAYMILEHFAEDSEETDLSNYGYMLWGNHNDDFRQNVKGFSRSVDRLYFRNRGWQRNQLVGYMESHDEERMIFDVINNGFSDANYSTKALPEALNRTKAAAAIFLGVPGPKMLWQFGELGYDVSINFNGRVGRKPIRWEYARDPERSKLYKAFAELIKLKTSGAIGKDPNINLSLGGRFKRITSDNADMKWMVVANFDTELRNEPSGFLNTGTWYDFFTGQAVNVTNREELQAFRPGEFHVYTTKQLTRPEAGLVPWAAYTKAVITALEPLRDHAILTYPNPSAESVTLDFEDSYRGMIQIQWLDANGRRTHQLQLNKTEERLVHRENVGALPLGTYLVHIQQGSQVRVQKWVKQ